MQIKVGDLVKRRDPFAEWQKDNPWLKSKELTGVVVETANPKANGKMRMVCVHWFTDGVTIRGGVESIN